MLDVTENGPSVEDAQGQQLVSVYVSTEADGEEVLVELQEGMKRIPADLAGETCLAVEHSIVDDQEWAEAWKQFYHPIKLGQRLVIKPTWEPWPPVDEPDAAQPDDLIIELDPEMAFGTGTHQTTQLCLIALEDLVKPGQRVADIGCGSGILSVGAALLGAGEVMAVDVDPVAVSTSITNAARNLVDERIRVTQGDINAAGSGPFQIIVANVNAPVVSAIAPKAFELLCEGGYYLPSGTIEQYEEDVAKALRATGFQIADTRRLEGWVCFVARKPGKDE